MNRVQTGIAIAAGVLVAFLVGFGWQYSRARAFQDQLDRTRTDLALQRMEATLGAATIEAQRGAFEPARQLASDFFTRLQSTLATAPAGEQAALGAILRQRDPVITQLSRADPQSGAVLADLFVRYRLAVGEKAPAPPTPADSAA